MEIPDLRRFQPPPLIRRKQNNTMKITKIKIENFKSIKEIEFDLKKYGSSYTTMLVGINESGKSNILEAISYLNTPKDEFDYNVIHHQKDEDNNPVIFSFSLAFEYKQIYVEEMRTGELLDFEITNIVKDVCLHDYETVFSDEFSWETKLVSRGLFIKNTGEGIFTLSKENDNEESFQELTQELFEEVFSSKIENIIRGYEPNVSLWRPSEEYLVSEVNLNEFKENIHSNIPLRNIFYIAGFDDAEKIKSEIERIGNQSLRRKLASTLGSNATKYVKNIWKHNIVIDIEIAEIGTCTVSIRDNGRVNEHNFYRMTERSEGFKQFMSLILSLSVDTRLSETKNHLILIDEPEAHLHPSAIRDLRKELLEMGKNNYLFVSTHSPCLVDRKDKERNIIIKKNTSAETEKIEIDKNTDMIDDEVLREAFGIEVYKDLLNPHSILVEGASDKKILQMSFAIKDWRKYGVTNGHGSNIDTLASKLNDTDISILVILDDDREGKEYKEKIRRIGGSYSENNVVTIRDLVGNIVDGGTIEDTLGSDFVGSKAREVYEVYKNNFKDEECGLTLADTSPFLEQVRTYLQKKETKEVVDKEKTKEVIDKFLEELKAKISNDFNPSQTSFTKNFPLLDSLITEIYKKLG